ncbi:acetolactate synthase catalytic subunit [Mesorhizobium sp. RP14(2022)]|uniref:Acetolactate synthase catalytic subunit n=1 Tax=Mesorhizobium liriopis TaxID=2953882 RepID=A0ABT1CC36_9HYPH|nr:acetolactate synthase catalytic subunit [Mesorhizobium liriopis]MCO6052273.1 acetolactate synthase catalytic subunit [Mesorhizobium liriopis]
MTKGNMSGAHVMAQALKRHGVEVIFGQAIPAALFLAAPHYGIRQIGYRTENAGAVMADAYARISHKVPVVTAQNGPAATLLVAGLAEAYKASIPIVAIVQDVARPFADKNAFQELDHLDLFKGVAKWIRRVADVDRIEDYVDMAFAAAASGRPGPAVLIAPIDMFLDTAKTAETARTASLGTFPLDRTAPDPERLTEAAKLLAEAERPLIIAGGGVHVSGAADALADLQERFGLPVATTVMGKGAVDERHPLSVGIVGYFMAERSRSKHLRDLVTEADVVLLIGNRTNQNGTDSWQLYPKGARYIHLDVDGQEIGRNYEALRLVGDAKLGIEALSAALENQDLAKLKNARSALEQAIAIGLAQGRKDAEAVEASDASPIRPERLMRDLDTLLTANDIVVSDASYSSIWIGNHLTARKPGMRFLTPRGLAGLGWGLPYAIGAKCARPEAKVFALVGDGGFAHVWAELETARRMGLHVVVAVLNNSILGYEKHAEKVLFNEYSDACDFSPVDHAQIARGAGCQGVRVERAEDFLPALETAFAAEKTTVLDVITDERAYPPISMFNDNSALQY